MKHQLSDLNNPLLRPVESAAKSRRSDLTLNDIMKSKLERKWWFVASTSALAVLATIYLINTAGISPPNNFAQWAVCFLCFVSFKSGFSFAGWLLVLCLSPSQKALERTK